MARGKDSDAVVAPNPRVGLLRPIRHLLRSALGLKERKRRSKPRTEDDRAIAWLFPYLALSVREHYPPLYENRDALILQMGRVASISIQDAIRTRGYNAYHSHGLSQSRRWRLLKRLEVSRDEAASRDALGSHVHTLAHHELLRWYQRHKRRNGERLRIVALTRDPASWMSSNFALRQSVTLPQIKSWHAIAAGADGEPDDANAIRAFGAAFGRMILEVRPSRGLDEAKNALRRIAAERWPDDENFAGLAQQALACCSWFDSEIKPLLGIDLLADPALRGSGVARHETEYAEIIALRFEDLATNVHVLGDFLGLPNFALPHVNATPRAGDGASMRAALAAGIEAAGGPAVRRELRATDYGKACGYDRLSD